MEVFAQQNRQLIEEFNVVNNQLHHAELSSISLQQKIDIYRGEKKALDGLSIDALEEVEKELKKTLQLIEDKKVRKTALLYRQLFQSV